MKLVPVYNKVIVDIIKDEEEKVTASGIVLAGAQPTPFYRGKVTGVGKGSYQNAIRIELDIKEGDVIVFLKNSGMAVEMDAVGNATKVVLADGDVFAVEVED